MGCFKLGIIVFCIIVCCGMICEAIRDGHK